MQNKSRFTNYPVRTPHLSTCRKGFALLFHLLNLKTVFQPFFNTFQIFPKLSKETSGTFAPVFKVPDFAIECTIFYDRLF